MPELVQDGFVVGVWVLGDFLYTQGPGYPPNVRVAPKDNSSRSQAVPGLGLARELAANATTIYASVSVDYVSLPEIWRCDHGQCAEGAGLFSPFNARSLHADNNHVYWVGEPQGGSAWRCETSGCVTPEPVASPDAVDIAIDDTEIWWITGTAIHRAPK